LPDQVWLEGSTIMVSLNLGYSFAAAESWGNGEINQTKNQNQPVSFNLGFNSGNYGFAGGASYSTSRSLEQVSLLDMNGDGLVDVVYKEGAVMEVAFNTGSRFNSRVEWRGSLEKPLSETANKQFGGGAYYTCSFWIPFTTLFVIINPGVDGNISLGRREAAIIDINGDGYPDHVESNNDGHLRVAINQIGRTHKLKKVIRPLGASFELKYKRDGNTYDMPQSKWVMSEVIINDGHPGDGVDSQVMAFSYESGKYDRLERDFYGYQTVTTEILNPSDLRIYKKLTRNYRNDSYYAKGLVESEEVSDGDGRLFTKTVNHYRLLDLDRNTDLINYYPYNTLARVFPQLERTERYFYEGGYGPAIYTYISYEYDQYGNITWFFDAGNPGADDDLEAVITYYSDLSKYIMEKPKTIEVYGNRQLQRKREGSYDPNGNLTSLRQAIDGFTKTQVTNFEYYPNGNLKKVIGPANHQGQCYTVEFEYDPMVQTYITKIMDSFGYISTATYNYKYGVESVTTDLNGNAMTKEYDNFGRLQKVFSPYDTTIPAVEFAYYHLETPARAVTKNKIFFEPDNKETLDTVLFIDGLKRVIQTKKEGEVLLPGDWSSSYGMNVTGQVLFDLMGRVEKQGQPVFQQGYDPTFYAEIS
jgi:hypothetical protein